MDLKKINDELRGKQPAEIIRWALQNAKKPILTTNFRPYEAAILHAVTSQNSSVPVIWCDTGYNTPQTYNHAKRLIEKLNLKIDLFVPQQTVAYRAVFLGIPTVDSPEHSQFTEEVKLEPFARALQKHQPDLWFTNLRKDQTAFRSALDIVTRSSDGILKVCPFFEWTEMELDKYLEENNLENELNYFDPTKVFEHRECGLHTN